MFQLLTIDGKKTYVCPACIPNVHECQKCHEQSRKLTDCHTENGNMKLCPSCVESLKPIKGHTYRPAIKFFGLGSPHIGVELEVENKNEMDAMRRKEGSKPNHFEPTATIANWIEKQIDCLFYCKRDGSIGNGGESGIEIVSHPFTFDFLKKHKKQIASFLKDLESKGCYANPATCGMHVHLSRKDLSTTNIYKILRFFKQNEDFIKYISGRHNIGQMDRYASVKNSFSDKNLTKSALRGSSGNRYAAFNQENKATVEIRIFQSTLDPHEYFKNIEFAIAIYSFSKDGSLTASYEDFLHYVEKSGMYSNLLQQMQAFNPNAKQPKAKSEKKVSLDLGAVDFQTAYSAWDERPAIIEVEEDEE